MSAQLLAEPVPQRETRLRKKTEDAESQVKVRVQVHIIFSVVILALFVAGLTKLLAPSTLPIRHVRIQGNFHYLSTAKMQSIVTDVIKGGFFNLNVMDIREALMDEPWVERVVVKRIWPDALDVHVKEQIAVAHWNRKSLLNGTAGVFTPEDAWLIEGLPYLSGPEGSASMVFDRFRLLEDALKGVASIRDLGLSERRAWRLQLARGSAIILGRNDVQSRIDRLTDSVLPNLHEELVNVEQIDMRYTNGFAIKWRNNSEESLAAGKDNG